MIELPEAIVISRQLHDTIMGKTIQQAIWGQTPHTFAFMHLSPRECEEALIDKTIDAIRYTGSHIIISAQPGYVIVLGNGGGRILYHRVRESVPEKHQALLAFTDGTFISVSIQGWGSVKVIPLEAYVACADCSPDREAFTLTHFLSLFPGEDRKKQYLKEMLISKPGIPGMGNGCLEDILFDAGIHPRARAYELSVEQREDLYHSIKKVMGQMISEGGRDTEHDVFNNKGGYRKLMCHATYGKECPKCSETITRTAFMGGQVYYCPSCQMIT